MDVTTFNPAVQMDALASQYADIVLANLARPYPFASQHVETSLADRPSPQQLHPAFHTSFDWHSCVHMTWLGVSLLEHGLDAGRDAALRAVLSANLTAANLAVEGAYLAANPSWERPYGWAWLVRLAATAAASKDEQIRSWGAALNPLVDVVASLVAGWTAKAEFPVRHGLHTNAAFGLGMMLDSFRQLGPGRGSNAVRAGCPALVQERRRLAGRMGNERPGLPVRRPQRSRPHGPGAGR